MTTKQILQKKKKTTQGQTLTKITPLTFAHQQNKYRHKKR